MRKLVFVLLFSIPIFCFSQQQLFIKGIHPNFYIIHTVAANDTYYSVAQMYNTTPSQVANYNDLSLHNGKIFAQTLRIPLTVQNFVQQKVTARNEVMVPVDYMLNTNESVTHVLARFKLSIQTLKELNNLSNPQLYTRNQFTVGYLKVNPNAASHFNLNRKASDAILITKQTEIAPETAEPAIAEQRKFNGIREAKRRGDRPPVAQTEPVIVIRADSLAVKRNTEDRIEKTHANTTSNRVKVFVDCSNTWCDKTFIKKEINLVDFMPDKFSSDVHMLITSQQNGIGGSQFRLIFLGQNNFKNLKDTLRFNLDPNATDVDRRDMIVKYIKFGLTPFIARTDYANEVTIQMKKIEQKQKVSFFRRIWNFLSFR